MNIAQIPLVFCAVLVLAASIGLIRAFANLHSLDNALKQLPKDIPVTNPFNEGNRLGKAANEYAALFSLCATRNALGSFRVEQASAPVQAQIRILTNSPRNLAGVIILCGLLVTLFNLQGAVGVLGESFSNLASGQMSADQARAEHDVQLIQQSMGEIAKTARTAFLRSGQVILTAAIIVWVSLLLQKKGQRSGAQFTGWANAAYFEAVSARPMDQHAQIEKFGEMIEKMAGMIVSFESVSNSMAAAGDLGSKLDASSQIVAQAVSQLPESINASVVQLSAEVTKDISVHLQHQIEHLKKVLAIYGDQENRVKKIQECLDAFSGSMEASANAVTRMSALPDKIEVLSSAIIANSKNATDVAGAAKSLSKKVDELPIAQVQEILIGIQAMLNDLPLSVRSVLEAQLNAMDKRIESMNYGQVINDINTLRDSLENLPSVLKSDEVYSILTRLSNLIIEGQRSRGIFERFRTRGAGS